MHPQARSGGCSLAWKFSLGIGRGVFDLRIQSLVCVLAIHLNFSLNCFRALSTLGEEAHTVSVYRFLWFHLILEKSLYWEKGLAIPRVPSRWHWEDSSGKRGRSLEKDGYACPLVLLVATSLIGWEITVFPFFFTIK